jgi:HK97 family phage prohead protease
MKDKPEVRRIAVEFEVRSEGESPVIRGHAAIFNSPANVAGMFDEQFLPGAFTDSVRSGNIIMLWQHDPSNVLGSTASGTLKVSEDERGLAIECTPPRSAIRELEAIQRGDVRGMSLLFRNPVAKWERRSTGLPLRTISKADVVEVSATAIPIYRDTDISVRSSADVLKELNSAAPIEPPADNLTAIRQRFEFDRQEAEFHFRKGN